jgi:SsrA-binding protein
MSEKVADRVFASNRRAWHDYHILESVESGLVLTGTEVKSIRAGKANLREGYARVANGELWLHNVHVAQYEAGNIYNHEPTRTRKLLLHKGQIGRLAGRSREQGLTIVPLKLYEKKGRVKLELGLAKGKRQYDKREALAERESKREIEREIRNRERER